MHIRLTCLELALCIVDFNDSCSHIYLLSLIRPLHITGVNFGWSYWMILVVIIYVIIVIMIY